MLIEASKTPMLLLEPAIRTQLSFVIEILAGGLWVSHFNAENTGSGVNSFRRWSSDYFEGL